MICSACGKDHFGRGCKLPYEFPPPPTADVLEERRKYGLSEEFKRECEASLAGKNPHITELDKLRQLVAAMHPNYCAYTCPLNAPHEATCVDAQSMISEASDAGD